MSSTDNIVVRVKYQDELRFISLSTDDLKPTTFACRVARAFKVVLKEGDKAKFYDNLDTPIPEGLFSNVLKTFHCGSSFFVHVTFFIQGETPTIVTPFMLKQYFLEKGAKKLFLECEAAGKNGIDLSDTQKRDCVNVIADYGVSVFGLSPERHQYRLLAFAAIDLFEALKSKSESPIDLLINTSEAGTTGRLYNRFRYLRKIDKGKNPDTQPLPALPPDEHPTHSLDDLLYLKTAVISNSNIVEVRKKLEKTRTLRDELVRAAETDLMEQFPFFFTHPQLILDDFAFKFNQIHPNALSEAWPQMSQKLHQVLDIYYPKQAFDAEWSKEIQSFLILLRCLPYKPAGRSLASAETFQNCVKRLLVFSNTSKEPAEMEQHKNTQPYIIAFGTSKETIDHYSIQVDDSAICVPRDFSFVQVMDLFIKLHHIFGIKFDERLQNSMFFLKYYVFNMKQGARKPATKMIELHDRLLISDLPVRNLNQMIFDR